MTTIHWLAGRKMRCFPFLLGANMGCTAGAVFLGDTEWAFVFTFLSGLLLGSMLEAWREHRAAQD
jgi:hypothetical protein